MKNNMYTIVWFIPWPCLILIPRIIGRTQVNCICIPCSDTSKLKLKKKKIPFEVLFSIEAIQDVGDRANLLNILSWWHWYHEEDISTKIKKNTWSIDPMTRVGCRYVSVPANTDTVYLYLKKNSGVSVSEKNQISTASVSVSEKKISALSVSVSKRKIPHRFGSDEHRYSGAKNGQHHHEIISQIRYRNRWRTWSPQNCLSFSDWVQRI